MLTVDRTLLARSAALVTDFFRLRGFIVGVSRVAATKKIGHNIRIRSVERRIEKGGWFTPRSEIDGGAVFQRRVLVRMAGVFHKKNLSYIALVYSLKGEKKGNTKT